MVPLVVGELGYLSHLSLSHIEQPDEDVLAVAFHSFRHTVVLWLGHSGLLHQPPRQAGVPVPLALQERRAWPLLLRQIRSLALIPAMATDTDALQQPTEVVVSLVLHSVHTLMVLEAFWSLQDDRWCLSRLGVAGQSGRLICRIHRAELASGPVVFAARALRSLRYLRAASTR